ncbi:hypothetical protein HZA56_05700 [Candidatus Poribacteria bacterium]|nr:hypothetical protein [Candidatus Poribacteria bacterium]
MEEAFRRSGLSACGGAFLSARRRSDAAETTEKWFARGIRILLRENLKAPAASVDRLPAVFFAKGDKAILDQPLAATLHSRVNRAVCPGDPWISATKAALAYAGEKGLAVVSSYGNVPYSVVCTLALAGPLVVVCPEVLPFMASVTRPEIAAFLEDLSHSGRILFLSAYSPGRVSDLNTRRIERDRLIAGISTVLLAGEIRKNGNMERILSEAKARGTKTVHFSGEGETLANSPAHGEPDKSGRIVTIRPVAKRKFEHAAPELEQLAKGSRYLIHYTRACPGPWPGQKILDYCRSLVHGDRDSTHTAFDTLMRIIEERRVRGGARLTRGNCPVVSFTECVPREVRDLTEWRPALVRWSFEPYGVAFPLQSLFRMGARPVIYAVEAAYQDLSEELRHLFQLQSPSGRTWAPEKEWRIKGDLEISDSLGREMVIIVRTLDEARKVEECCGFRTALAGL